MPERRSRRRFPAAYKLKMLAAAAQCTTPGAVGALLRREGLYASHLAAWRAAHRAGTLTGLTVRRGPKAAVVSAHEITTLERQLARALTAPERQQVLDILHAPRFVDLAPGQVYATLLDERRYLCSDRTMYRVLAAAGETQTRRAQRPHPV